MVGDALTEPESLSVNLDSSTRRVLNGAFRTAVLQSRYVVTDPADFITEHKVRLSPKELFEGNVAVLPSSSRKGLRATSSEDRDMD